MEPPAGEHAARPPLRILQTSDVHLGPRAREPRGLLHRDECLCPIDVIDHLVGEHEVDVVLIVGDLFDNARVSGRLVSETFAGLGRLDAEVALLPGNHDVYDETTVYLRHRRELDASGIRFFDEPTGATVDLLDGALRIWARAMDEHTPAFEPLVEVPTHPGDRWYIAAAHGHFVESETRDGHRSSRVTIDHIEACEADYVALGHWHATTDLAEHGVAKPAWYSGAPMFGYGAGRMLLVDLVPDEGPAVRPLDVLEHPATTCA